MKHNSDNEIEIAIRQESTSDVLWCCVCRGLDGLQSVVDESCIGSPPILISDLILQCFDSHDKYREVLGEEGRIRYLCVFCEKSLLEFYDALQTVSLKRNEFISRVREKNTANDAMEYFVIVESAQNKLNPSYELTLSNSDAHTCKEDFVKVNDSNDEYIELNSSEDEFVEVNQPVENFDDKWLSDYSNSSQDADVNHKQETTSVITIERMPESKLRFCWRCDQNFPSDDAFEFHLKLVHTKIKKLIFSCQWCKENFDTEKKYKTHFCVENSSNKLLCEACNAVFNKGSDLQLHKKVHENLSCSKCPKKISSHRNFQRHMMMHRLDKKHHCPECGNKYTSKAFLEKHMLVHKDVRSFVCPVCDFTFRTAWNLKRHQKLHCLGNLNRKPDINE